MRRFLYYHQNGTDMTEHFNTASPLSAAHKRPLKVFPSTGPGLRLCHIIPLWDAYAQNPCIRLASVEDQLELEIRRAVREIST
jgi:hypothetical protein